MRPHSPRLDRVGRALSTGRRPPASLRTSASDTPKGRSYRRPRNSPNTGPPRGWPRPLVPRSPMCSGRAGARLPGSYRSDWSPRSRKPPTWRRSQTRPCCTKRGSRSRSKRWSRTNPRTGRLGVPETFNGCPPRLRSPQDSPRLLRSKPLRLLRSKALCLRHRRPDRRGRRPLPRKPASPCPRTSGLSAPAAIRFTPTRAPAIRRHRRCAARPAGSGFTIRNSGAAVGTATPTSAPTASSTRSWRTSGPGARTARGSGT